MSKRITKDIFFSKDIRKFPINGLSLGNIGVFAGLGSSGKSFFILDFCYKYVLGKEHFLTKVEKTNRNKILYISNEDDEFEISKRLKKIFENDGTMECDLKEDKEVDRLFEKLDMEVLDEPEEIYDILKNIKKDEYDIIIFDTFSSIFDVENENDNSEVSKFIKKIKTIVKRKNSVGLILHHLNQTSFQVKTEEELNYSMIRGATSMINNCRYGSILYNFEDKKMTVFSEVKANSIQKQNYKLKNNIYMNGIKFYTDPSQFGGRNGK